MMTDADFIALLKSGGAVAFDTNAVWGERRWLASCGKLRRWCKQNGVPLKLVVPALVHQEKLHDLRHQKREDFDIARIDEPLKSNGIEIVEFSAVDADGAANWLYGQFPDLSSWREAKRSRALQQLNVQSGDAPGQHCSATVDWHIAGQAVTRGWLLVTSDRGPEFHGITSKVTLEMFVQLVERVTVSAAAR
jgi:hypothetical protein